MGLHVCQLMGYGQIDNGLQLISHNSAKTLALTDYGREPTKKCESRIFAEGRGREGS